MVITLLAEDESYSPATVDDAARWAEKHGKTHPVLADPGWAVSYRFITASVVDLPSMHLVAPGGEVLGVDDYFPRGEIESYLAAYR